MKNISFVMAFFTVLGLSAQNLSIQIGYGLGYPGDDIFLIESKNGEFNAKIKRLGLAGGLNLNLAYGIALGDHIDLNLGLNYHNNLSKTFESPDEVEINSMTIEISDVDVYQSSSFRFSPTFKFHTGGRRGDIKPYARIGPGIWLISQQNEFRFESVRSSEIVETERVMEFSQELSFGVVGGIGCDIPVGRSLVIFGELSFSGAQYVPKSAKLTKFKRDGVDLLDDLPVSSKEFEYVKELSSGPVPDDDKPSERFAITSDFSAIQIGTGLRIIF